jgi:DNA-binding transcriptional LysR family regulator
VEAGSVSEAARRLGLPRPTLSRQLSRLEEDLGVALLLRTTRKVCTTASGQRLYDRVAPLLTELDEAEQETRSESQEVRGLVRVSALPLVAAPLSRVCIALKHAHPGLRVEVVANVHLVDLRSEGFDVALWAGDLRDPDLISRPVAVGNVGLVAAGTYLAEHGTPDSVDALAQHTLLTGHNLSGHPRTWWPRRDGTRFRIRPGFVSDHYGLLKQATIEGMGIAMLSDLNCREAIDDGRLLRVLPEIVGYAATLQVVFPRRSLMPARLRVFLDALFQHFEVSPGTESPYGS